MTRWLASLPGRAFFTLMMLGSAFITLSSLVYFEPGTLAPFVIEKLPVRFESLWLASLRIHVATALVSFPLCLVLMTRFVQRHKRWHRWIGRVSGVIVVGALVPTGIILAFDAKGGAPVTLGFLLSGLIILWGMISGVQAARRRQFQSHSRAMRHVVAQMSVAVTSRAMLIAFAHVGVHPDTAYLVALWVPVLGSALVAEHLSGRLSLAHFNVLQPASRNLS